MCKDCKINKYGRTLRGLEKKKSIFILIITIFLILVDKRVKAYVNIRICFLLMG